MKHKIFLILILFVPICIVNASEVQESETIISENIRYFKTTTFYTSNDYSKQTFKENNSFFTETIEITEEEYYKKESNNPIVINSYNIIETTYKKLKVSISEDGDNYKYKAELEWKNMPKIRSYDNIGIGFYKSVKALSINFNTYYCLNDGNCYTSSSYYAKNSDGGVGATFKLPTSTEVKSIKSTLTANIVKNVQDATIIEQVATAEYVHAQKSISSTLARNYIIGITGIDLTSENSSYYDNMGIVTTKITCNW